MKDENQSAASGMALFDERPFFEKALAHEAHKRGYQGVVCGHIHRAEIRMIDGVLYCNDGDWVESCTALTEAKDGSMAIIDWAEHVRKATEKRALTPA